VNSEELELSLRTEFEEHLKSVSVEMRQELAQLQEKVEAEFEKHKSQMSEVFRDFSARIETEKELGAGFSESVVEHLRLARDEGARITATAIAEAEDMQKQAADAAAEEAAAVAAQAAPSVGISDLRDAISDISSQNSQSSILKTLVSHAAKFTTRGAFFILKNEYLVGWRVFGSSQEDTEDQTVREIFFPVASETVLGESVRSLSAVESSFGTYEGDSVYLDKLEFGQPERMFAIPLVARGRGVAVLYADSGAENEAVNVEALETLVRVAGLTVEVIASSPAGSARYDTPPAQADSDSTASVQPQQADEFEAKNDYQSEETPSENYQPETQFADSQTAADYSSSSGENTGESSGDTDYQSPGSAFSFQPSQQTEVETQSFDADDFEVEVIQDEDESDTREFQSVQEETPFIYEQPQPADTGYSWNSESTEFTADTQSKTESYQSEFEPSSTEDYSAPAANDFQFENYKDESGQSLDSPQVQFEETAAFDSSQSESALQAEDFSLAKDGSYDSFVGGAGKPDDFTAAPIETPVQPMATPPVKSRFSDRNVDLPIEVSEDERRLHNDARRFARLLVSEIKLYNEQKVKEGREARDLYERLREAIDRSREMYDKRVQPPVAAKFDYFHYELVSTLAEGEAAKLGGSYQGATV
jgi:hypothetical protein